MSPEILSDPEGQFPLHYNRSTFMFPHGLSGHPLLQLPSLIDLADRLEKYDGCYWSNGPANVTDRWEKGADRRQSLRKTIENIEDNNSLVILKFVVHDPIVGPFFRDAPDYHHAAGGPTNGRGCSGRPREHPDCFAPSDHQRTTSTRTSITCCRLPATSPLQFLTRPTAR